MWSRDPLLRAPVYALETSTNILLEIRFHKGSNTDVGLLGSRFY
jgi:hypothetical protein